MAHRKRKPSASQRDKATIEAAKYLKRVGALSPSTKLHAGRYVSRGVLKRVRELEFVQHGGYKTVAVSKALAQKARDEGYSVVRGNRIIAPPDRRTLNRLRAGELSGVRPVRGGTMEVVHLPGTIMDMHALVAKLGTRQGLDALKQPDEIFAFKFFGNDSYMSFINSQTLLDYLTHYKSIFSRNGDTSSIRPEDLHDQFRNLVLIRMKPDDWADLGESRSERRPSPRYSTRPGSGGRERPYRKPKSQMLPAKAKRLRAADAELARRHRAGLEGDALERYREQARARAKKSHAEFRKKVPTIKPKK